MEARVKNGYFDGTPSEAGSRLNPSQVLMLFFSEVFRGMKMEDWLEMD